MKTNLFILTLTLLVLSQAEAQRLPASVEMTNESAVEKITDFINSGAYMTNKSSPLNEEARRSSSHLYTHVSPERMELYKRWLNDPMGPDTGTSEINAEHQKDSSK